MDITPQDTTQPISDDQELAKALAGVMADEPEAPLVANTESIPSSNPSPSPVSSPMTPEISPSIPPTGVVNTTPLPTPPTEATMPVPTPPSVVPATSDSGVDPALDSIKKDALNELRPLVDRVSLPAEEKFDIYLMLIRSTDDTSLIGPAHTAAQGISDEKRKAEALLEIIKEIDYLSRKDK